ncbi:Sorcin [Glycine soja]
MKVRKPWGGRGFLVPDDVFEALVKIGFMLDSPAFYSVCESFDQSENGRFQLDNLISICIFLQSARNLFNSFDTAKQGRVTLDLNQFVYCSKYTLSYLICQLQNMIQLYDGLRR